MLPVQVLWGMSSKMSTVQIAALVLVWPAQGKFFSIYLGMPEARCQLPAGRWSHQGCHPRTCTLICLLWIFSLIFMYMWEQSLKVILILSWGFTLAVNVICTQGSIWFKTVLHQNWYSSHPLLSHHTAFMNSEWNPEVGRAYILSFHFTADNNLLLYFLGQHPDSILSRLSYLWVCKNCFAH